MIINNYSFNSIFNLQLIYNLRSLSLRTM